MVYPCVSDIFKTSTALWRNCVKTLTLVMKSLGKEQITPLFEHFYSLVTVSIHQSVWQHSFGSQFQWHVGNLWVLRILLEQLWTHGLVLSTFQLYFIPPFLFPVFVSSLHLSILLSGEALSDHAELQTFYSGAMYENTFALEATT